MTLATFRPRSIKALYELALAEGEGVGTAYEYYAKRLVLLPWLQTRRPRAVLIAGLPQVYGVSLDFALLAHELGATLTVVDDRPEALDRLQAALATVQAAGWLAGLPVTLHHVPDLTALDGAVAAAEWAVCSEVVQRLAPDARVAYMAAVRRAAQRCAVFCPNRDNAAHVGHSGLDGLTLTELWTLVGLDSAEIAGYIDMPPFPPGITRSESQRHSASTGRLEALAMWGLQGYARAERWVPLPLRRARSHIVYAFNDG